LRESEADKSNVGSVRAFFYFLTIVQARERGVRAHFESYSRSSSEQRAARRRGERASDG
jgi:hypothetical protein